MKIEHIPVDRLVPYARNARTHSDEQIAQIAGSIAEFGFVNPILVGADDVIIAGHGRLLAARKVGLGDVPVIRLGHLSETLYVDAPLGASRNLGNSWHAVRHCRMSGLSMQPSSAAGLYGVRGSDPNRAGGVL